MPSHGVVAQLVEHLHGMQGVVGSSPISSTSMADVAQLVRALVCGTRCRRFESGYPPHYKNTDRRVGIFIIWVGPNLNRGSLTSKRGKL